jgi:hypothetical protein
MKLKISQDFAQKAQFFGPTKNNDPTLKKTPLQSTAYSCFVFGFISYIMAVSLASTVAAQTASPSKTQTIKQDMTGWYILLGFVGGSIGIGILAYSILMCWMLGKCCFSRRRQYQSIPSANNTHDTYELPQVTLDIEPLQKDDANLDPLPAATF